MTARKRECECLVMCRVYYAGITRLVLKGGTSSLLLCGREYVYATPCLVCMPGLGRLVGWLVGTKAKQCDFSSPHLVQVVTSTIDKAHTHSSTYGSMSHIHE